jgi:hypothetical protein
LKKAGLYPETLFSHGEMPDEAMEKNFEADNADDYANDYEDGLDEDDLDMFEEMIALKILGLKKIGINL